MNRNQKAVT